jgi:hypothetical protein
LFPRRKSSGDGGLDDDDDDVDDDDDMDGMMDAKIEARCCFLLSKTCWAKTIRAHPHTFIGGVVVFAE